MNTIVFILCLFCLSNLPTLILSSPWFRKGLGRVLWASVPIASNHQSEVLVLTTKSVIASLSIEDGSIQWRLPYPTSLNAVYPTAVALKSDIIVVQFSDDRLRSCRTNGSFLWEKYSCELNSLNGNTITYRPCDSGQHVQIDVMNGLSHSVGKEYVASLSSVQRLGDSLSERRTWQIYDTVLISEVDGRLKAMRNGEVCWHLEEGIAHSHDVALYPLKAFPMIVLLSELGFVAGLDGAAAGKVMWKVPVRGKCRFIHGHAKAVVTVCIEGNYSQVMALNAITGGKLLEKKYEDFVVRRAAIHIQCKTHVCVHLTDGEDRDEIVSTDNNSSGVKDMMQIHYEPGGSELRAFIGQSIVWKTDVPTNSKIVSVITGERHPFENTLRPPSVRVTGDRRVLFKYTHHQVLLVLSFDKSKGAVKSMLLDGRSGQIYEVVEHLRSVPKSLGTKGENWFVYTTWNTDLLLDEIHVVDMYQQPELHISWVRKRLRKTLFTIWNSFSHPKLVQNRTQGSEPYSDNSTCAKDFELSLPYPVDHPYIVRSSMVLTQVPVDMALTRTRLGVTEQSILLLLDSGQSTIISKSTLDARRPRDMNLAYASEYLRRYTPSLSLQSTSYDNVYVEEGIHPKGIQSVCCAPDVSRESSSHIVTAGLDLLFTQIHPMGKFDFLDSDFNFGTVLLVIAILLFLFLYSESLLRKTSLSRSW